MKKKHFYLPIEVKPRELSAKILLSVYAIKSGCRCYMGSKAAINTLLTNKKDKGGIFLFKGGMLENDIKKVLEKCDGFMVLDEEMGPAIEDWSVVGLRLATNTESYIDNFFVIGKKAYLAAAKAYPELKERIVVSGWPRVDLWDKQYKHVYKDEIRKIKHKYGDFILFSSDYGVITTERHEYLVSQFKTAKGYERTIEFSKTMNSKLVQQQLDFDSIIEVFKEIDGKLEIPIIIRPHPAEEHEEWRKIGKKFKQIRVIYEGEISPWLYASQGLLHRGCTTAVQAYMGRVRNGYIITKNSSIRDALPYHLSQHLNNIDSVISFCTRSEIKKNHKLKNEDFSTINDILYTGDQPASEIIVNKMLSHEITPEQRISKINTDYLVKVKIFIANILNKMSPKKSSNAYAVAPARQKLQGGISKNEVEKVLKQLAPDMQFKVTNVVKDGVMIEGIGNCA